MKGIVASLVVAASLGVPAPAARAEYYTITDLGSLAGPVSYASAINNAGQVVGWGDSDPVERYSHAFFYSGSGPLQDLGTFGGVTGVSQAFAVNDNGWVVGASVNAVQQDAFLWTGSGPLKDLGTLGGAGSMAYGLNNKGQIVGGSFTSTGAVHGFICDGAGPMVDLGAIVPTAVNDGGAMAGFGPAANGQTHAFAFTLGGPAYDLGTLGGTASQPNAISSSGQVVGMSYISGGSGSAWHAFLYSPGSAMQDLGSLGGAGGVAVDINDAGWIVGYSYTADGAEHAFVSDDGGPMQDLNSLIGSDPGWSLASATGINDSGQICGIGYTPTGAAHAFLLTPVPEPAAVVLLCAGAAALLLLGKLRPGLAAGNRTFFPGARERPTTTLGGIER